MKKQLKHLLVLPLVIIIILWLIITPDEKDKSMED